MTSGIVNSLLFSTARTAVSSCALVIDAPVAKLQLTSLFPDPLLLSSPLKFCVFVKESLQQRQRGSLQHLLNCRNECKEGN